VTLGVCLLRPSPAFTQTPTCDDRHTHERASITGLLSSPLQALTAAIASLVNEHDALKAAGCLTPPTIPPVPTVSPSGTRVPRDDVRIVDATKNIWTLGAPLPNNGGGKVILRNGLDSQGGGNTILFWNGNIYVEGDGVGEDWWQYLTGQAWPWLYIGSVAPDAPIVLPPPPPLGGTKIAADHAGVEAPPYQLVYRLFVDGSNPVEQPKSVVWSTGVVTMTVPKGLSSGTHLVQVAAVHKCPPSGNCLVAEVSSTRSLPVLELTIP
jgi:hypothetical protein